MVNSFQFTREVRLGLTHQRRGYAERVAASLCASAPLREIFQPWWVAAYVVRPPQAGASRAGASSEVQCGQRVAASATASVQNGQLRTSGAGTAISCVRMRSYACTTR